MCMLFIPPQKANILYYSMSGKSELKINSKFAEKYEKYRQKEELQRRKLSVIVGLQANVSQLT